MAKDKQLEGEWPLYSNETHPDAGIPGRDHSAEIERKRAIGRRRRQRGADKSVWYKAPDAPRALPLEREPEDFAIRIEQGVVDVAKGWDYTLGPRRISIWTAKMDPEPHRITWIEGITVIALEPKPKGRMPHDARTDAYIIDKPPARGEIKDALLFYNGSRDAARISVFWEDIKAKPAITKPAS
ncbi:MAG: hypothetical protein ABSD69_01945 [Candidatus Levyibacteriota bacterium]|jgi:hypothetical protein